MDRDNVERLTFWFDCFFFSEDIKLSRQMKEIVFLFAKIETKKELRKSRRICKKKFFFVFRREEKVIHIETN